MKKTFWNKFMAMALIVTMVATSMGGFRDSVLADTELTIEQIIASRDMNLALGKTITANPSKGEGSEKALSDGNVKGEHAATTFGTTNTFYLIDLGKVYDAATIDQVVTVYKEKNDGDTPINGYKIQYSADGINFYDVKTVKGSDVTGTITESNLIDTQDVEVKEGAVRYIKILYPNAYTYGIQAREIAVLDTDMDATEVEPEKCEAPAGVTAVASDYNEITYNIIAGENQKNFKYITYLDGTIVGMGVDAGVEYTLTSVSAGVHYIQVVAVDNGKVSDTIQSDGVNVEDIKTLIMGRRNFTNREINPAVQVVSASGFYTDHNITTAQKAVDGKLATGEGNDVCLRTASGSPQNFVVDLGDYYTPSEFERVLLAYTNNGTYAADTTISFSLDGIKYEEVGKSTGYKFDSTASINSVLLNEIDKYTFSAVRYVKVTLANGSSGWGYCVNEMALIANTEEPTIKGTDIEEAADIIVDESTLESIKYSIVASENQTDDTAYVVKIDGAIINDNAKAGVEYTYTLPAGSYELRVCSLDDGWQSKGIYKTIVIEGYTTYIRSNLNLANRTYHLNATGYCDNDNLGENYLTGSQDISAGPKALNDGIWTDNGHHTGYVQTKPDKDDANIYMDLGEEYDKNIIHSVISMYGGNANTATEYEIYFSASDDESTYEKVFYAKDVKWQVFLQDVVDVSKYKQDTVRYIKIHIITGNYARHFKDGDPTNLDPDNQNWGSDGYHINEIAVMANASLVPAQPKNVSAESPEFNKVIITWDDVEDQDVTYNIYMNNALLATGIEPGVNMREFIVRGGYYNIEVAAVKNGIERKSGTVSLVVKEETTTPKPTTPRPTTQEPTTQKPTPKASGVTINVPQPPKVSVGRTSVKKASAGKKKVSLTLKKVSGATGYSIKYADNKKMKKAKTKTSKGTKVTIKKLRKGKKYYFKARAFKTVNGIKNFGAWSKVKASKKIK